MTYTAALYTTIVLLSFLCLTYRAAYRRQVRHNAWLLIHAQDLEDRLHSAYATMAKWEATCRDAANIVSWADTGKAPEKATEKEWWE